MRPIGQWQNTFARRAALTATMALVMIALVLFVIIAGAALVVVFVACAPFEALGKFGLILRERTAPLLDSFRRIWAAPL